MSAAFDTKNAEKNNGVFGVVVGHLTAENEIDYEAGGGHLKHFHLTGDIIPTEDNDVVILGEKVSEDELRVIEMESFYDDRMLDWHLENLHVFIIPKKRLCKQESKVTEKGKSYNQIQFDNKTTSVKRVEDYLYINTYNFIKESRFPCYVFMSLDMGQGTVSNYGEGYTHKEVRRRYLWGQQIKT